MSTDYQIEFRAPHYIVRGADTVLEAPVYLDASPVAPSAGTITIYDGNGTAVVSAAAVTITTGIATYTVLGTTTASLDLSSDWWVVWSLTVAGAPVSARNAAALVRYLYRCPVSHAMILKREPTFTAWPRTQSSWRPQIEEAWDEILGRLLEDGRQPHLITTPHSLRRPALYLALSLIAELQATLAVGADRYSAKAAHYHELYEESWNATNFGYDTDEDGDTDAEGVSPAGVVYLSRPPSWSLDRS